MKKRSLDGVWNWFLSLLTPWITPEGEPCFHLLNHPEGRLTKGFQKSLLGVTDTYTVLLLSQMMWKTIITDVISTKE